MVYLVTKQLKYPLQRSSDDGGEVVGGATVASTEHNAVEIPTRVVDSRIVACEDGHPRGWPLLCVPHAPQYGQLQVQNTGSGIPAGACARKFEPLCTTKPGGASWVCIVCKKLCRHMGAARSRSRTLRGRAPALRSPYLGTQPCARLMIDDRCPFLRDLC